MIFNIYLNDVFFLLKDVAICNFADDTTKYVSEESLKNLLKSCEKNFMLVMHWFANKYMKFSTDKLPSEKFGYKHEQVWANIGTDLARESNDVKLLGITFNGDLKFDKHFLKLCTKANQKLSARSKMAKLLSFNKRNTLFQVFEEFQFKHYLIVWMFHSRCTNDKINMLHERALRIVYDNNVSTFDQLRAMEKSFCIHQQNIQRLLIEIYRALYDISEDSLKELFIRRERTISLRSKPELIIFTRSSRPDVFCKMVFWEISQNSQENTCAIGSFLRKLKAGLQLY